MVLVKRISIVLGLVLVSTLIFLAIFPPDTPRVFLNQRRAVQSIRVLNGAEKTYAEQHPMVGFACRIADLDGNNPEQPPASLPDLVLLSGTKAGYHFEARCTPGDSYKTTNYTITAVPTKPGITGEYALCSDESGQAWYSENGSISDCLAMHKPIERKYSD
jgi:hypothetical protein